MKKIFDLPVCGSDWAKSFYGKAKIIETENGEKVLQSYNTFVCRITAAGRQFAALSGSVPLAKPVRVDWLLASPARPDAVQYTDCLTLSSAYRWMEENAETETASCLALRPGGGERLS